jgi:phosphoserine aminotransferase
MQAVTVSPIGRRHNFSGGPGALPDSVLAAAREAIHEVTGTGLSVLGISHRSDWFRAVVSEAEENIRGLLGLPSSYHVLFLQGGSTLQFSMIPMTLLRGRSRPAEYLRTGYWSEKSIPEARREGEVRVLWDGEPERFQRLPTDQELSFSPDAAYLHYVSNETVEGLQFNRVIGRDDVTRVCDMSSDFLSRPFPAERFALLYAHSQKNLGPAGVTVVVLRDELLEQVPEDLPVMLDYRAHVKMGSIHNTPPVFAIYVTMLVTRWLRDEVGGLAAMDAVNRAKAAALYQTIDESDGFYRGHAAVDDRSLMNAPFTLPSAALALEFLRESEAAGFSGLEGHRSLGGVRASLYNAVTPAAVEALRGFMDDFRKRRGRP